MALVCGYFDSTSYTMVGDFAQGNKALSSDALARLLGSLVSNGVPPSPLTCFAVIAKSGLTVTRKAGFCMINGHFAYDDSDADITITASDTAQTVWVLMRCDTGTGDITCVTTADGAGLPLRSATQYDIVLAKIAVPAGATAITDAMITDCRYNAELCGVLSGALAQQVDVDAIYAAINAIPTPVTSGTGYKYLTDDGTYQSAKPIKYTLLATLSASGTFNPTGYPSIGNMYKLVLIGGGGSGGGGLSSSSDTYCYGGSGGGAGGIYETPEISIDNEIAYIVGAGGAENVSGSSTNYTDGYDGGNTTMSGYTASGGKKGIKGAINSNPVAGIGGSGTISGANGSQCTLHDNYIDNQWNKKVYRGVGGNGGTNVKYPEYGAGSAGGTSYAHKTGINDYAGVAGVNGVILVYGIVEVTLS